MRAINHGGPEAREHRDAAARCCHTPGPLAHWDIAYRATVELLSYQFHNSRYAWEQDHERRRDARARGDEFRTYTWADVFEDPTLMLQELHELIPLVALS